MIDVLIMTASAARQEWLRKHVSSEAGIRVCGVAPTFPFLSSMMSESSADVVLIDIQRQGQYSSVRDWLNEVLDRMTVLLILPEPDPAIFSLIRHAGPAGLLHSNASGDQIVQAIKAIALGLNVLDSALNPQSPDEEMPTEQLTPREAEVLRLLADGLGNREIAAKLNVSEHTIKFHIRSILGKLGAASRTEAVTRGLRSGLIEL
jgi:two-component system, NarL family, response regulator YdfI